MGKSAGGKQQVIDYFMSVHFGIAAEVDSIHGISVNEKSAWEGSEDGQADISVIRPDLFGGVKREGGLVGTVTFLPGRSTQTIPENLAGMVGRTSTTMPAYRGTSTVWFHGTQPMSGEAVEPEYGAIRNWNFGYGGQTGFQWSSNNPIIAQTVWAKVRRAPKGLDPTKAMIGDQANPIHMIYECLINTDWGMGTSAAGIDIASFEAAAAVLFAENFGLSMMWTRQTTIELFVTEVLDHIEATYFVHPQTGLITIKLIRDDYDAETVPVVTPDNAIMEDFQRKFPGEVINEIIVTWTNPVNEQEETVTVQNISAIARQGGQISSDGRNYYGARSGELATRLATRDLRTVSAPLATAKVRLLREFWNVVPGDVLRLAWPGDAGEPDINIVVRVGPVDYGKAGSSYIETSLVEDVFSLPRPAIQTPPESEWVDPAQPPAPMAANQVFTLPYYFASSTAFLSAAANISFPEVVAGVLAAPPNENTRAYELTTLRGSTYDSVGTKTPVGRSVLLGGLAAQATTTLPASGLGDTAARPLVGGFLLIGTDEATQEIAQISGISGSNYLVNRGLLDTVPRAWAANTPVWFLNAGLRIADEQQVRSTGESVTYKLLPTTSLGTLDLASAPTVTGTLSARPYLPLRPANVLVNGQAFGDVAIGSATTVTIQWATRNRVIEDDLVLSYTAGPVSPEYRQRTVVRVLDDATNTLIVTYNHLWTENELVLQRSWFNRFSTIRIEVLSERDGLESHQRTIRRVTGLPGTVGAPLPPAPPAAGDPPAQAAAPGAGVFSLISDVVGGSGESSYPVLVIAGTQDDPDADSLVARFRIDGTSDWTFVPSVALSGTSVRFQISNVIPNTTYQVEVAYLYEGGIPSQWRSLGSAVTADSTLEWSSVGGSGRPEDGATVGAPVGTNVAGVAAAALVADAAAAKADSASALATLSIISDDAMLSRDEKPAVRQQRDTIIAEHATIVARADDFAVNRVTLNTAYTNLIDYLGVLALNSPTDTGINRSVFNVRFTDYYWARQVVLDGIAAVASQRALWSNVSGSGRPQDNATRNEDGGGNLIASPLQLGNFSSTQGLIRREAPGYSGSVAPWVVVHDAMATGNGYLDGPAGFPVVPGERIWVSARYFQTSLPSGSTLQIKAEFLNGTGAYMVGADMFVGLRTAGTDFTSGAITEVLDSFVVPAGAAGCRLSTNPNNSFGSIGYSAVERLWAGRQQPAADVTQDQLPLVPKGDLFIGKVVRRGEVHTYLRGTYIAQVNHTVTTGNLPGGTPGFWQLWSTATDSSAAVVVQATSNSSGFIGGAVADCRTGTSGAVAISLNLDASADPNNGAGYIAGAKWQREISPGTYVDVQTEVTSLSINPGDSRTFSVSVLVTGLTVGTLHRFQLLVRRAGAGPGTDLMYFGGIATLVGQ